MYAWFNNATKRKASFDIEVSLDGENFTNVYKGNADGKTDNFEFFKLEKAVNAKYIKYIGKGSNTGTMNAVKEIVIKVR